MDAFAGIIAALGGHASQTLICSMTQRASPVGITKQQGKGYQANNKLCSQSLLIK